VVGGFSFLKSPIVFLPSTIDILRFGSPQVLISLAGDYFLAITADFRFFPNDFYGIYKCRRVSGGSSRQFPDSICSVGLGTSY
jgi:hypothetical protein